MGMPIGLGLAGNGLGVGLARSVGAAPALPWYRSGGAPVPVAVYQPKGAASLAASYVNLANPGTYNATPQVAPAFDAATGWTFAAAAWLSIAGLPYAALGWSIVIRATAGANSGCVFSALDAAEARAIFFATTNYLQVNIGASTNTNVVAAPVNHVFGAAGNVPYVDGSAQAPIAGAVAKTSIRAAIGANWPGYGPYAKYTGTVQAGAIYNSLLTAQQMAEVMAAAAAL